MSADINAIMEFLSGIYIASVATQNRDGTMHVVPIWYLFEDGALFLPTSPGSVKVRNVKERPVASVMVDSRGPGPLRAASAQGTAEVLDGKAAKEINQRCWARYCTPAGLADPDIGGFLASDGTVCIKVIPSHWIWFDQGPMFKGKLEDRNLIRACSP